jgi:hypothetical protein
LSSRSDPHKEATAHVDNAAASSSAMSVVCASASSRLVLHDLRSIADPGVCNATSLGL